MDDRGICMLLHQCQTLAPWIGRHAPRSVAGLDVYSMRCLFTFGHGGLCVDESGFAFMLPLISWCSLNESELCLTEPCLNQSDLNCCLNQSELCLRGRALLMLLMSPKKEFSKVRPLRDMHFLAALCKSFCV